jgi:hypothetical protein
MRRANPDRVDGSDVRSEIPQALSAPPWPLGGCEGDLLAVCEIGHYQKQPVLGVEGDALHMGQVHQPAVNGDPASEPLRPGRHDPYRERKAPRRRSFYKGFRW